MRLYTIKFAGVTRWFGTQAEANAGKKQLGVGWNEVDFPTDKTGLITALNELCRVPVPIAPVELQRQAFMLDHMSLDEGLRGDDAITVEMLEGPEVVTFTPTALPTVKMPGPPCVTLIGVEEYIQAADGGALASIASNVCWRIKELTKLLG